MVLHRCYGGAWREGVGGLGVGAAAGTHARCSTVAFTTPAAFGSDYYLYEGQQSEEMLRSSLQAVGLGFRGYLMT